MPKFLLKKHHTIDCDLISTTTDLAHQCNLPQSGHCDTYPTPNPVDDENVAGVAYATVVVDDDDDLNRRNTKLPLQRNNCQTNKTSDNDNKNHHLSKLTLSTSLHQLQMNDSNFITNHQNQHLYQFADTNNNDNEQPSGTHIIYECDYDDNQHQQSSAQTINNNHKPNHHRKHSTGTLNSAKCKTKQKEAKLDTVHVVVGNEACDLDSAVSCLLMFHIISKMSDEINGKEKSRTLYIPLLNTTRDMLDSKCEVLWFLQKTLCIDKSFLTCKDDIDWKEIKRNGIEVVVTLVDHNYNEEFNKIGRIVEIIDHHQIQNPQWLMENHSTIRTTIDTSVGSCATLIAERLFYIYAEHHVSDEILLLIYGTVLIDTICLSEKAKRFTRRDVYLLKKLDSLLGSKKPSRSDLYKSLVEVKNSNHELNFEKLMKRDLKLYKDVNGLTIGIGSLFGMAAKESLGLSASVDFDAFFAQNSYEAFIIMGLIPDPKQSDSISRDLVLISANDKLFDDLCKAFESESSKLDVVAIKANFDDPEECRMASSSKCSSNIKRLDHQASVTLSNFNVRIWQQRNVTSSRKVVAPVVLKVLHEHASQATQQ